MSNYYTRDNGTWWIEDGKHKTECEFSGSMEIAFQMGMVYAQKEMLQPKINKYQKLAEKLLKDCDKPFAELKEMNDNLEKTLNSQPKPSEVFGSL